MGKIDTSGWKEFRIGDYFKVEYGRFHAKDELGAGTVNYITTSGFNNGITNTCEEATHQGNCITVASDGAMGASFYQEEAFTTSNIVSTLTPLPHTPLNKYNALFLCAIIFGKRAEFGWLGFKMSVDRVRNLRVKLPSTPDGVPDWAYMESYMASLETKVAESLTLLQAAKDAEKKKVDTREWGEFKFGDLFDLHGIKQAKSQKLIPTVELSDGIPCVPYIVQSQFNNMVGRYVDKQWLIENNEPPVEGNALVLGVTLNACSYQPEEFGASQVITARSPCLNKNNGFFIAAIVRKRIEQFDYKEKPSFEKYRALKIMLPIDKTGQPDWAYMEEYMRKVEEKTKNVLKHFEKDRNGV